MRSVLPSALCKPCIVLKVACACPAAQDRMGDLQGALADFTSCIDLDPGCADAFHCKGCAHRKVMTLYHLPCQSSKSSALSQLAV